MDLLKKAIELHEKGFAVTPTQADKAAFTKGWTTMVGDNRVVPNGEFTQARTKGCGIILGHWHERGYLCFLDADCYHKQISRDLCDFIMDRLGGTHPYRIGQMPKFGVPVLMTDQWRKATSARFGDSHLELLGLGQQFVAYGDHPKGKGGQYQWFNGELSRDLPVLQEADLIAIFEEFERLCGEAGLGQTASSSFERAQVVEDMDPLEVAVANQPLDLTSGRIKQILRDYPAQDLDYHNWLSVGSALHHQHEGSDRGYKLWRKWSSKSDKHNPRQMRKKWASFGHSPNPLTMATIISRAKSTQVKEITRHKGGYLRTTDGDRLGAGSNVQWLIQDIIEVGTIGQVFAAPATGKTFFALDMAAHVAASLTWAGHKVQGGPVVFLAGEGEAGIERRLAALEKEKGIKTDNLYLAAMPNFGDISQVKALIKELKAMPVPPVMIVVDTLARATAGLEENSSKDMGPVMEAMALITRKIGCSVMAIHHTPKASGSEGRGSGAIKGAMDFEIRLERGEGDTVIVSCAKSKDAEPFANMAFRLDSVRLPKNHIDNFGDRINSAVVDWLEEVPDAMKRLTDNQRGVLAAYDSLWVKTEMHVTTPQAIIDKLGLSSPAVGVSVDAAREEYIRSQPDLNIKPRNTLSKRFLTSCQALTKMGKVAVYDSILVKL